MITSVVCWLLQVPGSLQEAWMQGLGCIGIRVQTLNPETLNSPLEFRADLAIFCQVWASYRSLCFQLCLDDALKANGINPIGFRV